MKNNGLTPLILRLVVEEQMELREFLKRKDISKRALTAVKFNGGRILVNGQEQTVRWLLEPGDDVIIEFPPEEVGSGLAPESGQLFIVSEDDSVLIVEKASGQATIPSRNQPNGTLANYIAGKYAVDCHPATVHVVTRLDTDTSGLVFIAKNRHIHHLMSHQLQQLGMNRRYIAFVSGWIDEDKLIIEQPIGRKDGSIIERIVRNDGQYARTDVKVTARHIADGIPFTAVELQLHTGRTHQIRVHMAYLGHPLIGDDLYGGSRDLLSRQALHCASLSFLHPTTNGKTTVTSPLPVDMTTLLEKSTQTSLERIMNFSG